MAGLHPPEAGSGRVPIGDYPMTGTLKTLAALGVLLARCSNMALSFRVACIMPESPAPIATSRTVWRSARKAMGSVRSAICPRSTERRTAAKRSAVRA